MSNKKFKKENLEISLFMDVNFVYDVNTKEIYFQTMYNHDINYPTDPLFKDTVESFMSDINMENRADVLTLEWLKNNVEDFEEVCNG